MKQYENNLDDIHALVAIFPEEIGERSKVSEIYLNW